MGRISERRVPVEDERDVEDLLNAREIRITTLAAQGRTNREIGAMLSLSDRTIGGYTRGIYEKLGFRSRIQLVRWAWKKGLVKLSDFPGPTQPVPQEVS